MILKRAIVILTCLSLLVLQQATAQRLVYDVYKGEDKIGEIKASRTASRGGVSYKFSSKVKLHLFYKILVESEYAVHYINNYLFKSETISKRDGKINEHSKIKWTGEAYDMTIDGNEMTYARPKKIYYSLIPMYFKEPVRQSKIFSERHGVYLDLKALGNHRYQVKIPGGGTNIYTFSNGKCIHVHVDHILATVEFKLQPAPVATSSKSVSGY